MTLSYIERDTHIHTYYVIYVTINDVIYIIKYVTVYIIVICSFRDFYFISFVKF